MVTECWAGIECLHAVPAGKQHQPLPTIVFYHGFTSSKEVYSYFAVALAQAGFRVLMPDADQHGSRFNGDANQRLNHFWPILRRNIDELPLLEAALRESGLLEDGRFAVAGASMGGMTALAAMVRYPQINSVACMMGSGWFTSLSQTLFPPLATEAAAERQWLAGYEVSQQLEKLANRPLLLWHGEADEVVPAAETQRLVNVLRTASLDRHLTYLSESGIGHKITPSALEAIVAFFQRHL